MRTIFEAVWNLVTVNWTNQFFWEEGDILSYRLLLPYSLTVKQSFNPQITNLFIFILLFISKRTFQNISFQSSNLYLHENNLPVWLIFSGLQKRSQICLLHCRFTFGLAVKKFPTCQVNPIKFIFEIRYTD